jgi:hypothetical protein
MFYNCNKLMGGSGTRFSDSDHGDKYTFACIDGDNNGMQVGYFTAVPSDPQD